MTKYFTQDLFVLYKIMFKKLIKKVRWNLLHYVTSPLT